MDEMMEVGKGAWSLLIPGIGWTAEVYFLKPNG